jgi:hypothetical protein
MKFAPEKTEPTLHQLTPYYIKPWPGGREGIGNFCFGGDNYLLKSRDG